MPELITRERALRNLSGLGPTAADNLLLDALIAAVSRAVDNHCGRSFAEGRFDEIYPGTPRSELLLRHYPVVSVERIASGPSAVLHIRNDDAGSQRATVQVTDAGLVLSRVASGVTATSHLDFADHVTLSALATAVAALGNGWTATVPDPADGPRASADLRALQGAFNARSGGAGLRLHRDELDAFEIDRERGVLTRGGLGWDGGPVAWRVVYHAGFAAVPDDVQEACAQWVAALFWQARRDPGLAHENVPTLVSRTPLLDAPASVRLLLRPYRVVRI